MHKLMEKLLRVMEDKADDLLTPHDPETKQYNREHSKAREWEGELDFSGYGACQITMMDGVDIAQFKKVLADKIYTIRKSDHGAAEWGTVLDSDGNVLATIDEIEDIEHTYENLEINWDYNV